MVVSKRYQRLTMKLLTDPYQDDEVYLHDANSSSRSMQIPIPTPVQIHSNNMTTSTSSSSSIIYRNLYHYRYLLIIILLLLLSLTGTILFLRINHSMHDTIMCTQYRYVNKEYAAFQYHTINSDISIGNDNDKDKDYEKTSIQTHTHRGETDTHVKQQKPSACIYLLTQSSRIPLLKRLLLQLHEHFNALYQYDVYIFQDDYSIENHIEIQSFITNEVFHNDNIHVDEAMNETVRLKQRQKQRHTYPIYIQSVVLTRPSHITASDLQQHTGCIGYKKTCNHTHQYPNDNDNDNDTSNPATSSSNCTDDWPVSYRDMCYFHAITAATLPQLQSYTYYLRLDDDSEILQDIPYDIFQYAVHYNVKYGFVTLDWEEDTCDIGLNELAMKYQQDVLMQRYVLNNNEHHVMDADADALRRTWRMRSSNSNSIPLHMIVYNNFELGRFDFWRQAETQKWLSQYVDQSKGIYQRRWVCNFEVSLL
jgi:hypothetical protein